MFNDLRLDRLDIPAELTQACMRLCNLPQISACLIPSERVVYLHAHPCIPFCLQRFIEGEFCRLDANSSGSIERSEFVAYFLRATQWMRGELLARSHEASVRRSRNPARDLLRLT